MKTIISSPVILLLGYSFWLASCGGGGGGGARSAVLPPPAPPTYSIGGTVSGLTVDGLSLTDREIINIPANATTFTFPSQYTAGASYSIAIATQPSGFSVICSLGANASGIATANIVVPVICRPVQVAVTTLAGSATPGSADGPSLTASFDHPTGIAVDAAGNIYVADSTNNTIREIMTTGDVITLAGNVAAGSADNTGAAASFNRPTGVAIDSNGNVFVADSLNNKIRKITPSGVVTTFAGKQSPGSADGLGVAASFNNPTGLAIDNDGNVYVADSLNNEIRKIDSTGAVTTLAGNTTPGASDGTGAAASFFKPYSVALDSAGNLYVADQYNNEIRKITTAGIVTTLAGSTNPGSADGTGALAGFNHPAGLALDSAGNLYVADNANNMIRKVAADGLVTTLAGTTTPGNIDGTGVAASFNNPNGLALDSAGHILVADSVNNKIRQLSPN